MHRWLAVVGLVIMGIGLLAPPVAAQEPEMRLIPATGKMLESRLAPDGQTLAVFENGFIDEWEFEGDFVPLQLVDLASGEMRVVKMDDYAIDAFWTGSGNTLITQHGAGWLSFWDVATGTESWRLSVPPGTWRMAIEPTESKLMVTQLSTLAPVFGVWNLDKGAMLSVFNHPLATFREFQEAWNQGAPESPAWIGLTPGGDTLIELTVYDRIWAWDVASGTATLLRDRDADRPYFYIRRAMLSGTTLAYHSREDQHLYTLDIATGSETDHGEVDITFGPAISADGTRLAWYGNESNTITVWDMAQPLDAAQVIPLDEYPPARGGGFRQPPILFTPDGSQVIFTGYTNMDTDENGILIIDLP